ncbi:MAG: Sau3AI family type II restriction endonuclease [Parabacteroides sp.]|nr:Sau3AI family type II restriction endonuclease [Parabacteroides sp.]
MQNIASLPYDKTSATSIFEYSKGLLNKTLRDFLQEDYDPKKGKGGIGQMVENLYFFLDTNNNPEADFSAAGMELKCTPLKNGKDSNYLIKERLVCNMINYCEVVKEEFEQSHFYLKCQLMLLLFYLYKKNCDNLDLEFIFSVLWKLPEKDLLVIKNDYDTIIDKIKSGQAHLLSEGDTMYLGACRKGQKGDSLMKQPFSEEGAPRRAFSLKMAYMRTILQYVLDSGNNAVANFDFSVEQLVTTEELSKQSFDSILLNRIKPYIGKYYNDIAEEKNVDLSNNPKSKFAMIANAILSNGNCSNVNRSEEFLKAGLTMKTIRVQYNGNIKEAMSFENIDYMEVAECDNWYDSRLYELFSSRFMFVVFKEQHANKEDYILDNVFFWTMPQEDLESAEEYWNHIRKNILENHISEEYWWKGKDKKKFHVRPKAQKSSDLAPAPNGVLAKKFCYWFNNEYVRQIVNRNSNVSE